MAIVLDAYPKLTETLYNKIGYQHDEYGYYYNDGIKHKLEGESISATSSKAEYIKLADPVNNWHPEEHNLIIETSCIINSPFFLFGPNGLAAADGGTIGVAVIWTDVDASIRGSQIIGEFKKSDGGPIELPVRLEFPPKKLRGTLVLNTVLYLKEVGNPTEDEGMQVSVIGSILGNLGENTKIIIDGNGSIFPVMETNKPGEPLWWVECNWTDPTEDTFTQENFCLFLNNGHKDYDSLNIKDGIAKSPMLVDIVSSAIQILVTEVLSNEASKYNTINGIDLTPNSISSVVNYYIKNFDWELESKKPSKIAKLIRMELMNRF